jgi:Putative peptidoglycan binding domain
MITGRVLSLCFATFVAVSAAIALLGLTPAGPAFAQSPAAAAPQAPPADPKQAAAQVAFERLPEAERRAIQDDLIWASDYSGVTSGSFGKRTFDAILAVQRAAKLPDSGILDPASRAVLASTAQKARAAAKFTAQTDVRTGVRIGVPEQLLTKKEAQGAGTLWSSADGKIALTTAIGQGSIADLPAAYERVLAVPGRKVTYKLLRPDFFVVTGESGTRRFYTRFGGAPGGMRGFTLSYEGELAKSLDRVVIAVANSFDPFPSGNGAASTGAGTAGAVAAVAGPGVAAAVPVTAPVARPAPAPTERRGNALLIAEGKAIVPSALLNGCKSITIAGRPTQTGASDPGAGISLLTFSGGPRVRALNLGEAPAANRSLVVLGYATGISDAGLTVTAAEASGRQAVFGALQASSAGSAVVDRFGRLVALVAAEASAPRTLNGVVAAKRYAMIPVESLASFASNNSVTLAHDGAAKEMTTGEIVSASAGVVQPLVCAL